MLEKIIKKEPYFRSIVNFFKKRWQKFYTIIGVNYQHNFSVFLKYWIYFGNGVYRILFHFENLILSGYTYKERDTEKFVSKAREGGISHIEKIKLYTVTQQRPKWDSRLGRLKVFKNPISSFIKSLSVSHSFCGVGG